MYIKVVGFKSYAVVVKIPLSCDFVICGAILFFISLFKFTLVQMGSFFSYINKSYLCNYTKTVLCAPGSIEQTKKRVTYCKQKRERSTFICYLLLLAPGAHDSLLLVLNFAKMKSYTIGKFR